MTLRDEGVIKFECNWTQAPLPEADAVLQVVQFRNTLFKDGLIGVYPDGIGFGNISLRVPTVASTEGNVSHQSAAPGDGSNQFVISASQTGHIEEATAEHFSLVTEYDIAANSVRCIGPLKASSESLTHAMIYEIFPDATGVIHVHHNSDWQRLQGMIPTSRGAVSYGTPEMAREVKRLAREENLGDAGIFVMAGHEDGILSFGCTLQEAYDVLRKWLSASI